MGRGWKSGRNKKHIEVMRVSKQEEFISNVLKEMEKERKSTDPIIACLGSIFGKDCVWHAIIPTMLSSIYAPLPNNPTCTMALGRNGRDTPLSCVKCNKLYDGQRMQLGLRVLVSKGPLLDNKCNYMFGFEWTLICMMCCGAQRLMDVSRSQLDYLENWVDSIAGNHCCESLSRDVTAPILWREVRALFDAKYFDLLNEFGCIRNACSHCNAKNPKNRCAGCKLVRYCNVECAKAHWPRHKDGCDFAKSRTSVFEKEASYKVLFSKN